RPLCDRRALCRRTWSEQSHRIDDERIGIRRRGGLLIVAPVAVSLAAPPAPLSVRKAVLGQGIAAQLINMINSPWQRSTVFQAQIPVARHRSSRISTRQRSRGSATDRDHTIFFLRTPVEEC